MQLLIVHRRVRPDQRWDPVQTADRRDPSRVRSPAICGSERRSVVLGAGMPLRRSAGEGLSSLPAPNTLRHSRYTTKGDCPFNLTSARLPNSAIPNHERAPPRQRRVAVPARQIQIELALPRAKSALRFGVRAEVSVSARRLCEHGNAHRSAAGPMSTAARLRSAARPASCPRPPA